VRAEILPPAGEDTVRTSMKKHEKMKTVNEKG